MHTTTSPFAAPRARVVPPLAEQRPPDLAALDTSLARTATALTTSLPSHIPLTKRGQTLARGATLLAREHAESVVRIGDAVARLNDQACAMLVKRVQTEDAVAATVANMHLRTAVLPLQIELAKAELLAELRRITGSELPHTDAATDFDRYWDASDAVSIAARTATVNAANGIITDTPSAPHNSYAGLLFAKALARLKQHDPALRDAFMTLRSQLAVDAVPEDVRAAAASTLAEERAHARRAEGLGSIVSGLRGMAGGAA